MSLCLSKGVEATTLAKILVASTMECENRFQLKSWYGRVPSYSNISDNPSRGSDEQLIAYGSQRAEVNWGEILNTWIPIGGNDGGGSDESPLWKKSESSCDPPASFSSFAFMSVIPVLHFCVFCTDRLFVWRRMAMRRIEPNVRFACIYIYIYMCMLRLCIRCWFAVCTCWHCVVDAV